jgi:hypothetical protein
MEKLIWFSLGDMSIPIQRGGNTMVVLKARHENR